MSAGAGDAPLTTRVLHLDDLPAIDNEGMRWHPLRRELGLTGFGAAVYSALEADTQVLVVGGKPGAADLDPLRELPGFPRREDGR